MDRSAFLLYCISVYARAEFVHVLFLFVSYILTLSKVITTIVIILGYIYMISDTVKRIYILLLSVGIYVSEHGGLLNA